VNSGRKSKSAVLTVKQFAERFGVSKQHVLNLIDAGQLQAVNIGIGSLKFWRIPVAEAERYESARLNVPEERGSGRRVRPT